MEQNPSARINSRNITGYLNEKTLKQKSMKGLILYGLCQIYR